MEKYKIIIILFSVLLILSGIKIYDYKMEDQEEKRLFMNQFHTSVYMVETKISSILENEYENKQLENEMDELNGFIKEMFFYIDKGNYLGNEKLGSVGINTDYYYMNGIRITINDGKPIVIPPFAEDGKLDENEISYLKEIQKIVKDIDEKMTVKDNGKVREDITYKELEGIISELYSNNHNFQEIFTKTKK